MYQLKEDEERDEEGEEGEVREERGRGREDLKGKAMVGEPPCSMQAVLYCASTVLMLKSFPSLSLSSPTPTTVAPFTHYIYYRPSSFYLTSINVNIL